jgi:hypothetical protein
LGEDRAAGVVHRGQQVDLRAGVVAAAAQGLAVDRDRPPATPAGAGVLPLGQPPGKSPVAV